MTVTDGRGRHTNRPRTTSEDVKEQIREHIRSFPRRQSHYSQSSNCSREYLPEGLSIAEMHRLYLAQYEPQAGDKPAVKEWLYRKVFNEDFNLGFGYPQSDTCQLCDGLKIALEALQIKLSVMNLTCNWLNISSRLVLDIRTYERTHKWPNLTQPCFTFANFGFTTSAYTSVILVMV